MLVVFGFELISWSMIGFCKEGKSAACCVESKEVYGDLEMPDTTKILSASISHCRKILEEVPLHMRRGHHIVCLLLIYRSVRLYASSLDDDS